MYEYLYVQLMRVYGIDQDFSVPGQIDIYCATTEYPDDPYCVYLYVDWASQDYFAPLTGVIECRCSYGITIKEDWMFSFDPIT